LAREKGNHPPRRAGGSPGKAEIFNMAPIWQPGAGGFRENFKLAGFNHNIIIVNFEGRDCSIKFKSLSSEGGGVDQRHGSQFLWGLHGDRAEGLASCLCIDIWDCR